MGVNRETPSSTTITTPSKTATPVITASKSVAPTPTKAPATPVTFATVKAAVDSGKSVICVTNWWSEKGPDQYRLRYYIGAGNVRIQDETNSDGKISMTETTYLPGDPKYTRVLSYNISSATCTQQ